VTNADAADGKIRHRILLRGGRVVTAGQDLIADVLIERERIVEIRPSLTYAGDVEQLIDVTGRLILPGAIDMHVHFEEPGPIQREGYATGTMAAAAGGITMVVEHPLSDPPTTTEDRFVAKRVLVEPSAFVDFGLWGGVVPGNIGELAGMVRQGAAGFKAFMVGSEPELPRVEETVLQAAMQEIARLDSIIAVHCEDQEIVERETARLQRLGRRDPAAWGASRPEESELSAVEAALATASITGCRLHLVHVSVPAAAQSAARAREQGIHVAIETCLHHLVLDETDVVRLGPIAKCAPPLRARSTVDSLWRLALDGTIDFVASDHAPYERWEKAAGDHEIWLAPNGCQSLQLLTVLGLEAWERRGGAIADWVRLVSAGPARWLGLFPRKGSLEPGADADLAIYRIGEYRSVLAAELLNRNQWTPFEGMRTRYTVESTMVRGRWVYREGRVVWPPVGRFVPVGTVSRPNDMAVH
jgi:allantoinase